MVTTFSRATGRDHDLSSIFLMSAPVARGVPCSWRCIQRESRCGCPSAPEPNCATLGSDHHGAADREMRRGCSRSTYGTAAGGGRFKSSGRY
jgi:hypothetical protein